MRASLPVVFWGLFVLLVYIYVGYPLVLICLNLIGSRKVKPTMKAGPTPSVTLIISAHNEENVIGGKLHNSLALDYPRAKLEIIVAANGCTDGTDEIVRSFAGDGVCLHSIVDAGKTLAQNAAVPLARGDLVVFSDANSMYRKDAMQKLAGYFANQDVGLVQGRVQYEDVDSSSIGKGEGLYWRYEDLIKQMESRLGSCTTANGGILAIRRELFEPIPPSTMEDFMLPILVLAKGYKSLSAPEAVATEKVSQTAGNEFRRKVRIITQDSRAFLILLPRLLRSFRWFLIFQLTSHKLLRWLVPFFLLPFFLSNLFLAADGSSVYGWILFGQLFFYVAAMVGFGLRERRPRFLYIPFYFCMVNSAALLGVTRAVLGVKMSTWSKSTTTR